MILPLFIPILVQGMLIADETLGICPFTTAVRTLSVGIERIPTVFATR